MAQLGICGGCKGWVPDGARRCPHCERFVAPGFGWAKTALALAGSGVAAMTLMACYGGPCAGNCVDPPFQGGNGADAGDAGNVQNFQYCGLPDAGVAPCYPDGGLIDLDAGSPDDGGSSDGG